MVPHPSDVFALHDMNRRELIARAARERLADAACAGPRRSGARSTRLPGLVLVVAFAVAALLGLAAQHASGAALEGGSVATRGRAESFVGAWRFTDLGFDLPSLATMTEDGNLLLSNLPVEPVPPDLDVQMLLLSGGHGVWEVAGEDRADITFVSLYVDETGTFQSSATLSGALELAPDGQALRGEYAFEVREPEGTVVHAYTGEIEGARIGLIAMEEMAASSDAPAS